VSCLYCCNRNRQNLDRTEPQTRHNWCRICQGSDDFYYSSTDNSRIDFTLNDIVMAKGYLCGYNRALDLRIHVPESPFYIRTMDDYQFLYEVYYENLRPNKVMYVVLETDLDFSGWKYELAFGNREDGTCRFFTGLFEGNGHSITNYDSSPSFFCGLSGSFVQNLTITESCHFHSITDTYCGFSDYGSRSVVFRNVTNKGSVSCSIASGFIARVYGNPDITFIDCANEGTISGLRAFGFCNGQNTESIVFVNCINRGSIQGGIAYGFTDFATIADNVINIGSFDSGSSFCFWRYSLFTINAYGLKNTCSEVRDFNFNLIDSKYNLCTNGTSVSTLLNSESLIMNYDAFWSDKLELMNNPNYSLF